MKLVIYSHAFYPAIGGVETVSMELAKGLTDLGHEVVVITQTEEDEICSLELPFKICRCPGSSQLKTLIKEADIVFSNGASLYMVKDCILQRKPFVWTHVAYQAVCIDGLGWHKGEHAPLTPVASLFFHLKKEGFEVGLRGFGLLILRRFVGRYIVGANICITEWVKKRIRLPRSIVIYNPFPLADFKFAKTVESEHDFLFLGRISGEKGIDVLIKAFSKYVNKIDKGSSLLLIGDGPELKRYFSLAVSLGIEKHLAWVGRKSGEDLITWVAKCGCAIVPSSWEEAMGGVAIELLAAGKRLIVSSAGGLAECVGDAALTFKNGDVEGLFDAMCYVKSAEYMPISESKRSELLKRFDTGCLVKEYEQLFKKVAQIEG